jgi:hypothetical protein
MNSSWLRVRDKRHIRRKYTSKIKSMAYEHFRLRNEISMMNKSRAHTAAPWEKSTALPVVYLKVHKGMVPVLVSAQT